MKILRNVFEDDTEQTTMPEEKVLTIPIKPGLPPGTKFTFPEVGDQGHTIIPGTVCCTSLVENTSSVYYQPILSCLLLACTTLFTVVGPSKII